MTTHLSTLSLHRLRYGELAGDALARAKDHLDACELCAGRLRAQQAERASFVASPVPDAILAIGRERRAARPWWREWLPLGLALATAALLSLVVREVRVAGPVVGPDREEVRFRGTLPELEVWVQRPGGARPLRPGETVSAGDRVQLEYDPRGASAVAIAGRDGSGRVEVFTTDAPTGVGLVAAPFSLTLDAAPGDQELFVVGSDRPLTEDQVKAAVTRGVDGARVARVTLPKRGPGR